MVKNQSVTFLFDSSEAAKKVALVVCGEWDGLNKIFVSRLDEVAIQTAASLNEAEYCLAGDSCLIDLKMHVARTCHSCLEVASPAAADAIMQNINARG